MSTDAINTGDETFFVYPKWNTLLGPASGDPPGSVDEFENAHAFRVVQSASGSRLDFADIRYGLTSHLINRVQPADFTRVVDVTLPDGVNTRLHRGDYVTESERVEQAGEALTAQSQMRPYHFGEPITGMLVYDPIADGDATIPYPVQFNPTVDGQVRFNRSGKIPAGGQSYYWLHAEAAWTSQSEDYHGGPVFEWELQQAIDAICDLLNFDETYIDNPDSFSLLSGAPKIRDITLPMGWHLPQCLDTLLIPLGFNWYVDYGEGNAKPKITLFEIGTGTEKELHFQAPGESLNLQWSNVNQYAISRSIGDSFNEVKVLGGFKQYEVTLPLYPGWPETEDETTPSELLRSRAGAYEGNEHVWRLFVANEDGTLDPAVSRLGQTPDIPDLSAISDPWVARRRTLEEPLTYIGQENDPDKKERRPFWLEYADEEPNPGDDPEYKPVPEDWSVRLLPDQIGVYFDGDQPPQELFDAGDNLRMRITGTITVDERLVGEAAKESFAVNGRTNPLILDVPDKFVFRERLTTGDYQSVFVVYGNPNDADERDDSTEITTYAEQIRDKNHHAEMDCEFRLPGLHIEYQIGDLLTNIKGREVSLDAASDTATTPRYVQIVERRWEFDESGPFTVLIVDRGVQQG